MADPEDISERFWSQSGKADEEARREQHFLDDVIQKAHIHREINSRLDGVCTVLDAGAGPGRFSIPLAKRGLEVTHLDIAPNMLALAQERAREEGVSERLTFVRGRIGDLAQFAERQFDLVVCCDAPVSYTYPDQFQAISQLARVASAAMVLSVSSRLGYVPYAFNPNQKAQYLADPNSEAPDVRSYGIDAPLSSFVPDLEQALSALQHGILGDSGYVEREYREDRAPFPHNYLFLDHELSSSLEENGFFDIRLSGPGALSRSIPGEVLRTLLSSSQHRDRFLDLCYRFDTNPSVCGMGKDNLVASALRRR